METSLEATLSIVTVYIHKYTDNGTLLKVESEYSIQSGTDNYRTQQRVYNHSSLLNPLPPLRSSPSSLPSASPTQYSAVPSSLS